MTNDLHSDGKIKLYGIITLKGRKRKERKQQRRKRQAQPHHLYNGMRLLAA
jgi:hypothetical protein